MDLLEGVSRSYFRQRRREKGAFSFLGGAQAGTESLWPVTLALGNMGGRGRHPLATVTIAFIGGVLLYIFPFKLSKQALK